MSTLPKSYIRTQRNRLALLPVLAGLLLLSASAGVLFGSTEINFAEAIKGIFSGELSSSDTRILLYVRLPRVCATLLSGCALALSGVMLQAVLNNPLASPNVIGVNAGAGFFTFLVISLFPAAVTWLPIAAFFGAVAACMIIYGIASRTGASKVTLVLAGIAISSIFTAGINAIKTFFPDTLYNGSSFLIGGFSGVSFKNLFPAYLFILPAATASFFMARQLDVLCLGDETASGLGMNVTAVRMILIILACVLAGAAVSFSGLVSFVGLIVPHICRGIIGTEHKFLLPASCLSGGIFMTVCDLISRVLFAPYEVPVGILLSLVGGPFFICLLLRKRGRRT